MVAFVYVTPSLRSPLSMTTIMDGIAGGNFTTFAAVAFWTDIYTSTSHRVISRIVYIFAVSRSNIDTCTVFIIEFALLHWIDSRKSNKEEDFSIVKASFLRLIIEKFIIGWIIIVIRILEIELFVLICSFVWNVRAYSFLILINILKFHYII